MVTSNRQVALLLLALVMPALLHAEDRLTASAGEKELRGLIAHPDPEYPEAAMEQLLEGEGLFKIVFDPATGRAAKVTVEKSTGHPLLDAAATKGMMRWRSNRQQLTVLSERMRMIRG